MSLRKRSIEVPFLRIKGKLPQKLKLANCPEKLQVWEVVLAKNVLFIVLFLLKILVLGLKRTDQKEKLALQAKMQLVVARIVDF